MYHAIKKMYGCCFVKYKHILSLSIMRTTQIASGLLLMGILAVSCTRENAIVKPAPAYSAGKGGKAKLNVTPRHHLKEISDAKIYIEYNAARQPSDGLWDDSAAVVQNNGKPVATFDSLKPGNYFMYAKGFDPAVNDDVIGTGSFKIVDSLTTQTYSTYIEVSEADNANH